MNISMARRRSSEVVEVIAIVVLLPFVFVWEVVAYGGKKTKNYIKRRNYDRKHGPPLPLPVQRKRALTLPIPPDADNKNLFGRPRQKTYDQSQSALFSKLPGEVRTMIYKEVLCGPVPIVHIVTKRKRKLGHVRCRGLKDHDVDESSDSYIHTVGSPRPDIRKRDGNLLPLLQSCRRIYTEAIDILYSGNTFSFYHWPLIVHLSSTILPRRWEIIQSIHFGCLQMHSETWPICAFCWFGQHPYENRQRLCQRDELLSSMRGLRRIKVTSPKITEDRMLCIEARRILDFPGPDSVLEET